VTARGGRRPETGGSSHFLRDHASPHDPYSSTEAGRTIPHGLRDPIEPARREPSQPIISMLRPVGLRCHLPQEKRRDGDAARTMMLPKKRSGGIHLSSVRIAPDLCHRRSAWPIETPDQVRGQGAQASLISTFTPAARSSFISASTVCGVGCTMSSSRLGYAPRTARATSCRCAGRGSR
jgi:hypothetical protein